MQKIIPLFVFLVMLAQSGYTQFGRMSPADSLRRDSINKVTQLDYKNMLAALQISSTRPGPSGNPQAPNAANIDESKASPYTTLPDPLVLKNGKPVKDANTWWKERRPEIVADFDQEVYGKVPAQVPKVRWEVTGTQHEMNGSFPVTVKKLLGHVDNSAYPSIQVAIQLTLTTPADATGPVPVIMEFGFVFPPGFNAPRDTAKNAPPTWQQQILAKGWGYAIIVPTSYQADNGAGLTQGIIGLVNKGQPRKPEDWGALRAWAWGASRAIDYFETDKAVDTKRLGIEGLSRYGKATIVAMAYEPRLAIAFVGSSGAGGAKILRRVYGEQVENLAASGEYHWFAGNFIKYAGPQTPNDLPVDAHELVALCAPRPVYISVGSPTVEGRWVDAKGMFLGGVYAGPVYKLLGKKDLGTVDMPEQETGLTNGEIAFRQHAGGHTTGPNWPSFLVFAARYFNPAADNYPFQNPALSFEERVNDLVGRLSLEEKVAQMLNSTPAIPHLGIPAYDWWNEVLHGVARTPYRVTVFPQAIGMAASFDTTSLAQMADYAALEGRAVYNQAVRQGKSGQRYVGLTYWTPNINIFRDPRWGRGQETYGEDPFLTACLGRAFVRGLQGNDPKYLKAAACAKHYAVHSGPEPSRHVFNATPTKYDLWNTYLPAFKELVTKSQVAGVMCAYNAFNGQPCCGSDQLMVDILRNQWQFTGYVTSDCWAIDDFFKNHKTHPDAASAAADAVLHGTDIDCGTDAYKALVQAVGQGKITEKRLDVSLKRLFMIRFRLGLFDPPSLVPWAQTPETVLEKAAHGAHALKMAQQSIVLLKNEKNTLPLQKNIRKIAVIGPNADNAIAVLGNYNGTPSHIVTALQGIKDKLGSGVEVVYEKAVNFTNDTLLQYADVSGQYSWQGQQGFEAAYYNNRDLQGQPIVQRMEPMIDQHWQEGQLVVDTLKAYNFSVRYSTDFKATETGSITFETDADDGYRLLVDGKEVINAWSRNRWGARNYQLKTEAGKIYRLVLEYFQGEGKANVRLRAGHFAKTDFAALANRIKDADAIVFVGGISPQLEGEEMRVDYPGFNGGDRTSILLPAVQTKLLKALHGTGKPVVFVMMTGSAIALPWEAQHLPAIVNAWYGGQAAGTAIADVLFGDYNPAGRLPVTFYGRDEDLPDFNDYSMQNRTYRYFKGKAQYGFGYGLSYTHYQYDQLRVQKNGQQVTVSVRVSNTGKMDGEEVVQVYSTQENDPRLIRSLKGFKRIFLKAGTSQIIQFHIPLADLAMLDEYGKEKTITGKVLVSVGGSQPDVNTLQNKKTVQAYLK